MMQPIDPIEVETAAGAEPSGLKAVISQGAEGIVVQQVLTGGKTAPAPEASPDIVKRSIVVAGHKTSVSLEDAFWHALKDIARERGQSLRSLVADIDIGRRGGNLSSAVRLFVLDHYRSRTRGPISVEGI